MCLQLKHIHIILFIFIFLLINKVLIYILVSIMLIIFPNVYDILAQYVSFKNIPKNIQNSVYQSICGLMPLFLIGVLYWNKFSLANKLWFMFQYNLFFIVCKTVKLTVFIDNICFTSAISVA